MNTGTTFKANTQLTEKAALAERAFDHPAPFFQLLARLDAVAGKRGAMPLLRSQAREARDIYINWFMLNLLSAIKPVCPFTPAFAMTQTVTVKSPTAWAIKLFPSPGPVTYSPPAVHHATVTDGLLSSRRTLESLTVSSLG